MHDLFILVRSRKEKKNGRIKYQNKVQKTRI